MTKKFIWASWGNLDYSNMPLRCSYKDVGGNFEFPVNRFNVDNFLLELSTANITKTPVFDLNNRTENYEDRFYSIIDQIADDVYTQAGDDKKIALLYSGGVDSVCVLAALQRNKKYKDFLDQNRIFLAMTTMSITEYQWLFYNHILSKIPITALSYEKLMNSPDVMLVTGDGGDFVIGSSDIDLLTGQDKTLDIMSDYSVLFSYLDKMNNSQGYKDLSIQMKDNCPFEIKSLNQFVWWLSQCYAIQTEIVWPYVWSSVTDLSTMPGDKKVFRFFYHHLMITFSYEYMSTNPLYNTYDQTKNWTKRYSINHFGDEDFFNKVKVFSQRKTLRLGYKSQIYEEDGIIKFTNTSEKIR